MKTITNLVVGDSSQLSKYFPENGYEKISSRDVLHNDSIKNKRWNRVFLCFGENRTFIENENSEDNFIKVNVEYTKSLINYFKDISFRIIVYGTSELWNNIEGGINIDQPYDYNYSPYIKSKELLCNEITQSRTNFGNVIILHPVNFNSVYRKGNFLFGKIFDSIINKKKIEIGDTYFYRDLIHPKYLVERSILANKDEIVGSGRLIHINDFIRNLYDYFGLNYDEYVKEDIRNNLKVKRKIYYLDSKNHLYNRLFEDTVKDLIKII